MSFRSASFAGLLLLLCGCTDEDWDRVLTFHSLENPKAVQTAAPPAAAVPVETASVAPPTQSDTVVQPSGNPASAVGASPTPASSMSAAPDSSVPSSPPLAKSPAERFCGRLATNAGKWSRRDGFDQDEQRKSVEANYNHCMAYYGQGN